MVSFWIFKWGDERLGEIPWRFFYIFLSCIILPPEQKYCHYRSYIRYLVRYFNVLCNFFCFSVIFLSGVWFLTLLRWIVHYLVMIVIVHLLYKVKLNLALRNFDHLLERKRISCAIPLSTSVFHHSLTLGIIWLHETPSHILTHIRSSSSMSDSFILRLSLVFYLNIMFYLFFPKHILSNIYRCKSSYLVLVLTCSDLTSPLDSWLFSPSYISFS